MDASEIDLIAQFVRHLKLERRLSDHTATNYQRDLKKLVIWCEKYGFTAWTELRASELRRFAATLFRNGQSPRSIAR
ncbi:MAG: site-specific integrase, partial [Pseudomonadota bacterium]